MIGYSIDPGPDCNNPRLRSQNRSLIAVDHVCGVLSLVKKMASLYIVGAQCTGKTTLIEALIARLTPLEQGHKVDVIRETAREVLQLHAFTRDDIRTGGDRCHLLQKLILEAQHERESASQTDAILISDRSGVDPIAYATMYAPKESVNELLQTTAWRQCNVNLQRATVIVCEPVEDWLFDDGTRLMPQDTDEWLLLHETFCTILKQHNVQYTVLPAEILGITSRILFILDAWKSQLLHDPCTSSIGEYLTATLQ